VVALINAKEYDLAIDLLPRAWLQVREALQVEPNQAARNRRRGEGNW
jgi:hypothetical protein